MQRETAGGIKGLNVREFYSFSVLSSKSQKGFPGNKINLCNGLACMNKMLNRRLGFLKDKVNYIPGNLLHLIG